MAMHTRLTGFTLASCLSAVLTGCALHMPIPDDLASKAEEMPVRRKNSMLTDRIKWVHFGPYSVESIHKHGSPTDREGRFGHAKLKSETRYDFRVESGEGTAWTGDCRNHAEREDYLPFLGRARELGYRISLACDLNPAGGGGPWTMVLAEEDTSGGDLRGHLSDGVRLIEVTGTHEYRGRRAKSPTHTGFRFLDGTETLGAVELLGKQKVLIHESAPENLRPLLAAVSASLLLYEDLNARMKQEMKNKSEYGIQVASAEGPAR
jgi:hypothetical protein